MLLRAAVLAVFALALTVVGPGAAADPPPLSFVSDTPVEVSAPELRVGVPLEVRNDFGKEVDADFVVTQPPVKGVVAVVDPSSATIPAGGSILITVAFIGKAPPGTTTAVTAAAGPGLVARRTVGVAAAKLPVAEPAVKKLTLTVYRNRISSWRRYPSPVEAALPLSANPDTLIETPGALHLMGVLEGPNPVGVAWSGGLLDSALGTQALELRFVDLHTTGTYVGMVDTAPGDDKAGDVELTVIYKDAIWLPLGVILLGLAAGFFVSRATGVLLPYRDLLYRISLLRGDARKAQTGFDLASVRKPWAGTTIRAAVDVRARELDEAARRAKLGHLLAIPDAELTKLRTQIDAAGTSIAAFKGLAGRLQEIEQRLAELRKAAVSAPPLAHGHSPSPEYADTGDILSVRTFATLVEIDDAAARAAGLATTLARGNMLVSETVDLFGRAGAAGATTVAAKAEAAVRLLWEQPAAVVIADNALTSLEELRKEVVEAEVSSGKTPAPAAETGAGATRTLGLPSGRGAAAVCAAAGLGVLRFAEGFVRAVFHIPEVIFDAIAEPFIERDIMQLALLLAAFILAVTVGLSDNYVGKAFGTWWDYIGLFAWAFASKLVIDVAVKAIDSLPFLKRS